MIYLLNPIAILWRLQPYAIDEDVAPTGKGHDDDGDDDDDNNNILYNNNNDDNNNNGIL